jgi:hypothetical protein
VSDEVEDTGAIDAGFARRLLGKLEIEIGELGQFGGEGGGGEGCSRDFEEQIGASASRRNA